MKVLIADVTELNAVDEFERKPQPVNRHEGQGVVRFPKENVRDVQRQAQKRRVLCQHGQKALVDREGEGAIGHEKQACRSQVEVVGETK